MLDIRVYILYIIYTCTEVDSHTMQGTAVRGWKKTGMLMSLTITLGVPVIHSELSQ